jgi:predicted alpha/beta superfamily hydrolase
MVDPVERGREYRASEDYAAFLESELIPHVERRYRTLSQREARGMMGASLGGLISTYVVLSRPHLFSRVGGPSSAFHIEEARITALLTSFGASTAFYLAVGTYEPRYHPAHQRIVGMLNALARVFFSNGREDTTGRAGVRISRICSPLCGVSKRSNPRLR